MGDSYISVLRLEFANEQECFVRAEIDYGTDQGVNFGSDWMVNAPDEQNEGMHNWRPFCVDIYFWKHSMADVFVRIVDDYQKRLEAQAKLKASIPPPAPSRSPSNRVSAPSQETKTRTPDPRTETRAAEEEGEEEEIWRKNITSVDCLDCNNGEIFPAAGGLMECRVIRNQTKKSTKIIVLAPLDGGHLKLCYSLTDRSFPYQLPESTVQVRFMLVEKSLATNPDANLANLDTIKNAPPLDSPIFQFEQEDHAQSFLECLRGEQLLFNGIVDWVRSTRELKEGETSVAGPHPANFSCADDRRIQLWENELGFINIVFHRQFHLVSAFIAPSTQVENEAVDIKEPWRSDGTLGVLKLRFSGPEHATSFRESVLRHRDATAMLYPEVAKTIVKSILHETPETIVPPPPPPEFRHGRSMSTSSAVPLAPLILPSSPPQQFPTSPQSPAAHQTSFQHYALGHSQSVRINRPPPLPMFPNQPAVYAQNAIHSPRFQNAQPSPMTGTFAPQGLGSFPISSFPSPPGATNMPYQSPAAVASATVVPQIATMTNAGYFPTTITPMTPGLPSAKFPPPILTTMMSSSQQAGGQQQPPATPIREHMRQSSFVNENTHHNQHHQQQEPVELPASFPDDSDGRSIDGRDGSGGGLKFPKEDDIPEEEEGQHVSSGYNPLGGNVSIPIMAAGTRTQTSGEGGKMSRVWKKLK
ncbi:hypothetical protein ABW20_dc0103308 [Dactylellina cionopaga]|nr:hypothetical protein ABW20_dc0103308 [Dactylellina cionopaga]